MKPLADQHEDSATGASEVSRRRRWLGVLARASAEALQKGVQRHAIGLRYTHLRAPETGMVMLRARVGGTGDPFNLGEATVSRCTLRLDDGRVGSGHTLGRDTRKAEWMAILDALLQDPRQGPTIEHDLVDPLERQQAKAREAQARAAGATQVAFHTLVRGE